MTRFFRPNGSALLTLVAALLLATWPFFGAFTIGTLIAGFFLSLAMQSWHNQHPSVHPPRPAGAVHSEINLASIPVRGDAGGATARSKAPRSRRGAADADDPAGATAGTGGAGPGVPLSGLRGAPGSGVPPAVGKHPAMTGATLPGPSKA